jgi:signal transduction histidine kinase
MSGGLAPDLSGSTRPNLVQTRTMQRGPCAGTPQCEEKRGVDSWSSAEVQAAENDFLWRLQQEENPLAQSDAERDQLREQFRGVLHDALAYLGADVPGGVGETPSRAIGHHRLRAGVHPNTSLAAARVLFNVLLDHATARLESGDPKTGIYECLGFARAAHQAVMRRVAAAAVSYVEDLLTDLHRAHARERRRMLREVHDRASHELVVALQLLERAEGVITELPGDRDPVTLVTAAHGCLLRGIESLRQLAAENWAEVGDRTLRDALTAAAEVCLVGTMDAEFDVEELGQVPSGVIEHVFVVLREALRNSARHSAATRVRVTARIADGTLTATVTDNGRGFDTSHTNEGHGIGISSMHERARLVNGKLEVTSSEAGTVVRLTVPVERS